MGRFGKKIDDDQPIRFNWFEKVLQSAQANALTIFFSIAGNSRGAS